MKILKEHLKTLWYEDENGNVIPECTDKKGDYAGFYEPNNAIYQVSRFPLSLRTTHLRLIKQSDVDKCNHPRKYIVPTYGWIDGIVGRECKLCHGTQTKKKWHFWPRKWDGYGSREAFSFNTTWNNEEVILAMVNSGDFTLSEAIIAYSTACERCGNVLIYKYTNGRDGYEEHSEEWLKAGTTCEFCKEES